VPPAHDTAGERPPLAWALIVALAASLFAWLAPLSRWAYDAGMSPLPFVAWRAGIGALVLVVAVAFLVRRGRRLVRLRDLDRRARASLAVAVVTGLTLNLAIFAAFERTAIALALLGFYTYPALVAVVAVVLGRERLTRTKLVALGLATVGMILVVAGGAGAAGARFDILGILFALGASISQVVFVTVSRAGYRHVPADQAMALVLLGTALGCVAIGVTAGLGDDLLLPFRQPGLLGLLLGAGALGAALPSLLFLGGIRRIGATRTGILMLLEPVVGVGLAAWLLAEAIGPVQVVGGLAILGAAILIQRAAEPEPPSGRPPEGTSASESEFEAAEAEPTRLAPIPGGP
jgi:drug/metabolite transporter (DMT)-like permease